MKNYNQKCIKSCKTFTMRLNKREKRYCRMVDQTCRELSQTFHCLSFCLIDDRHLKNKIHDDRHVKTRTISVTIT